MGNFNRNNKIKIGKFIINSLEFNVNLSNELYKN